MLQNQNMLTIFLELEGVTAGDLASRPCTGHVLSHHDIHVCHPCRFDWTSCGGPNIPNWDSKPPQPHPHHARHLYFMAEMLLSLAKECCARKLVKEPLIEPMYALSHELVKCHQ